MSTDLGIDATDMDLDTSRKYSLIRGVSGAHYKQDGEYYGARGNLMVLSKDGTSAEPAKAKKTKGKKDEKLVEYDMDSITSIADFDLFSKALNEADNKPAKAALQSFAVDIVGMEKISMRKGLGKLIDEVRAEYKSVLEADID